MAGFCSTAEVAGPQVQDASQLEYAEGGPEAEEEEGDGKEGQKPPGDRLDRKPPQHEEEPPEGGQAENLQQDGEEEEGLGQQPESDGPAQDHQDFVTLEVKSCSTPSGTLSVQ